KDTADNQQNEFRLEQNRDNTERSAKCKRARIAHENLRGMRVVPEEADTRAHYRRAENRELACSAKIEDLEICGCVDATNDVRKQCQRENGNRGQSGGETVEAVSDVHGIARPRQHERHEQYVHPCK